MHTLQLAVGDAEKETKEEYKTKKIFEVIEKIRAITIRLSSHPDEVAISFRATLGAADNQSKRVPSFFLPCVTRWGGTYDMTKKILENLPVLVELVNMKVLSEQLSDIDIEYATIYINVRTNNIRDEILFIYS